ncbi:LacI family DNA-binding transcriptional regulator [Plantactinospora mayteni]|uniref:LacI family DNA-binding transcriptional regulator n=1 Tax=Plantactinospora mayteni TaxID=566021 RepID=UPI001EF5B618|nr:LacI family DNA-binding transcriptional regulator [Plantactinospora mayteni]
MSRAAGVSVYTVSRALSNNDGVSATSRELVLRAARELGYVPNRAAQELRKNTRSSVTVITASTSNYYYIDLMKGIQRTLRATDRTAIVADIAADGEYAAAVEDATVRDLIQSRTAGVIATLTLSPHNARLLGDWDIPVVFVDSVPSEGEVRFPGIATDNFAASMKVGTHLAQHGLTDWLFLVYPGRWSTRAERELGIRSAAQEHDARLTVLESRNDAQSAYETLRAYLDATGSTGPQAIIAGNNPMVHGTMRVLHEKGIRIPDDTAVVGFDEFAWAPLLNPPLTVLNEDSETIGVLAAQTLTRIIDEQVAAERRGEHPTPVYRPDDRRKLGAELIVRKSCGC